VFAAFGLGRFHEVKVGGIKNLIFAHDCCLWSWQDIWGQRQRQQKLGFLPDQLPLPESKK
jgi:hypothetical protein